MVQLQTDLEKIAAAGVQVVGISYDSVDVLKKFSDAKKITFPLLSDKDSKTIKAYGVHNKGFAHPGTILVDRQGVVRATIFLDGFRKRHSTEDLLAAAQKLQQ